MPKHQQPQDAQPNLAEDLAQTTEQDQHGSSVNDCCAALQARITELETQLKDEQLRSAATVQNLNRRHSDEIQSAHKFAAAHFAKEMLSVKDYLEMALLDQSGNFDALKTGVDMTLKQLIIAFDNAHLSEINPVGELLDPNKHQSMSTEDADAAPNTIIRVMQKGYALNERILRPALVVVASGNNPLKSGESA